jgi:FkbM family methyltransferase
MDRRFVDRRLLARELGAFEGALEVRLTVFDIGAHAGYSTLIASKLVGGVRYGIAFEPAPSNQRYFRRHLSLNHVSNVAVPEVAVSDRAGVGRFDMGAEARSARSTPPRRWMSVRSRSTNS